MATGLIVSNTNLVRKAWGKDLFSETAEANPMKKFIVTYPEANGILQERLDLAKDKGDNLKFGLRMRPTGTGVTGDNPRAGQEEDMTVYDDSVSIDQLWHGALLKGSMEEQKSAYNLRSEAKAGEKEWWYDVNHSYPIRVLSGDSTFTFSNTGTVPTSTRIIYAGSKAKATITTSDVFDVDCIKRAKETAIMASPKVPPLTIDGRQVYIMFLHPYQVYDLKADSVYQQMMREAQVRGSTNPLFTSALSYIDGVLLFEDEQCLTFSDYGSTVDLPAARAILCGRQAGLIARGMDTMRWHEEIVDRGNKYFIGADTKWGIKKAKFNSVDFAVVACDTYATSH